MNTRGVTALIGSAFLLVGAASMTACGGSESFDVTGALQLTDTTARSVGTVNDTGIFTTGSTCHGQGGYSDIAPGAQVVIRDAAGKSVGLGRLEGGTPSDGGSVCEFDFTVRNINAGGGGPYSVEIAHRGEVSFNRGELVALSLGD